MARDTKIEVDEKEVEVVYCDVCGDECTEDHEIEPQDVCPSCATDRTTYASFQRALEHIVEVDDDEEIDSTDFILCFAIWPLVVVLLSLGGINGDIESRNDFLTFILFTSASVFWTIAAVVILL